MISELAFYGLAGAPQSPADLIPECRDGEAMGFGTVFLSERFNIKEIATISGVAGAITTRMRITTAQLEDFAALMRRLWHGEVVVGHDGPAGSWPVLALDAAFREDIPLLLSAFAPNSLQLAGRCFDEVLLHTFFTDETLQRCVRTVKEAAEQAGRDPASVKVWSCYATIGDWLPEDVRLKKTVGRLATYLQAYGDLLVRTNQWDPSVLARFRADPFVAGFRGALGGKATTSELEHVATLIPDEWLAPAGSGTPEQCAAAVARQLTLGADGVILHGAAPDELRPIVDAYRAGYSADMTRGGA
jgi:probable F420-dependent oxidoreductase